MSALTSKGWTKSCRRCLARCPLSDTTLYASGRLLLNSLLESCVQYGSAKNGAALLLYDDAGGIAGLVCVRDLPTDGEEAGVCGSGLRCRGDILTCATLLLQGRYAR